MGISILADLIAAWRGVRAGRSASLAAVAALALGMGACLTASVIVYSGLVRPLPLREASDLVTIRKMLVSTGLESGPRLAEFSSWRDRLAGTIAIAAMSSESATLRAAGREPQEVSAAYITDEWFDVIGADAEAGRLIRPDTPLDVAVVSHDFANTLTGGRGDEAAALDVSFALGGRSLRVVGVLRPSFAAINNADVFVAARGVPALSPTGQDDVRAYRVVGRMAPSHPLAEADAAATRALIEVLPENQRASWHVDVVSLRDALMGNARPVLLAFASAASLVLLVACANVAMLLVNRAVARSREYSVRLALGADRFRLIRTAVFETAMLAAAGAALGAGLAITATSLLAHQTGLDLPSLATTASRAPIVAGAAMLTLLVVVVCGVAPTLTLGEVQLATSLRAPASSGSRGSRRVRGVIVVAQLAMTVTLLTGAGLLGRTFLAVSRTDIGLAQSEHVATLALPIGQSSLDAAGRVTMTDDVLANVRRFPGVVSAGIGAALPPVTGGMVFTIRVESETVNATRAFDFVPATPGYLESLGVRLVDGRLFTEADSVGDPVVVISESTAKHFALITKTAVGRTLNLGLPTAAGTRVRARIIGIIKDVKYAGLDVPSRGGVFVLWKQLPLGHAFLIARTAGDPSSVLSAMTRAVGTADPSMPLEAPLALDGVVDHALAPRAARFSVVGVFAVGAALLAFVGLSGALIRSVVERQRELAIRAAVGATPKRLVVSVLRHGAVLVCVGIALGLAASAALARGVATLFYGVTPHDPLTYGVTAIVVAVIALAACYLPARRAADTDPILLLRAD